MNIQGNKHLQVLVAAWLCAAASVAAAATTTVNLTAQASQTTMPDGVSAKMWQFCGAVGTSASTCSATKWAPGPTITVAAGDTLQINLQNQLPIPTSIVVLGQSGGGMGQPVRMAAPIPHTGATQTTFPAAGPADVATAPPTQVARVRSFATEVGSGVMVPLTWANLKPGTYIYQSGTLPSLQVPMGLYGMLVVTQAPKAADPAASTAFAPGVAYPAFGTRTVPTGSYDADIALLFSEVDPTQNAAVDAAARAGTSITLRFDDAACSSTVPCYPPAVNYTPTYFLINGQPFDIARPQLQSYATGATYSSGNLLLRLANAGSRLHVPAAIGLPFQLLAEDGNLAPGKIKVQNEVSLTAGKTQDVIVTPANNGSASTVATAFVPASFALFDRQLSTSTSGTSGGMQAFLQINGAAAPSAVTPRLVDDAFSVPFNTAMNGNVKLNDTAAASIALGAVSTAHGALSLVADGSFIYTPTVDFSGTDTFTYTASNAFVGTTTTPQVATVTLTVGSAQSKPIAVNDTYFSSVQSQFKSGAPGLLANDTDGGGKADRTIKVAVPASLPTCGGGTVELHADGSFSVQGATGATCSFTYQAQNSQGTLSAAATVTVNFGLSKSGVALKSGLKVNVVDAKRGAALTDYRWLVQEDLTFKVDPSKTPSLDTRTIGTSFHRSHMTVVASGCLGARSCGSGQSVRVDSTTVDATTKTLGMRHVVTDAEALLKSVGLDKVLLDPSKNYYISILPGDALDDAGGHLMGGVAVSKSQVANAGAETLLIKTSATPINPAQLSVFIYEDNNATNNQYDTGEKGLGGFNIIVVDAVGRSGDPAGQQTYDMFGMPLSNALLGTPGCPDEVAGTAANANAAKGDDRQNLVGVVYTCPNPTQAQIDAAVAADTAAGAGVTVSQDALNLNYALAGHALIKYLEPARYDIIAHPAAWREASGERWWQVETLEGTPAQDAFVGTNEPRYFQEFGPPGFHTSIGFVNPDHVTQYGQAQGGVKTANDATHHSIKGWITSQHMSRPSAVKLWDAGSYDLLSSTVCQVVVNSAGGTGPAIAITECNADGSFTINGIPDGSYEIQIWDRWLDQIIQAQSVTITGADVDLSNIPVLSWFTQHDQNIFMDSNGNGRYDQGEPGIANLQMTNRYRNGSISNQTLTDSMGNGILVELFPLFNWYVSEADTTRFKQTGVNVIVDAGGPVNNSPNRFSLQPDGSTITVPNDAGLVATSYQAISQGETGCNPDRTQANGVDLIAGPDCDATHTTDRVEIPGANSYGIQGFISQRNRIDWGRAPYVTGENGGIVGTVVYASTRPFDDQRFNIQNIWAPLIPRVTVNLYKKQVNPDGSTSLVLVDSTRTSSWDDWVQTVIGSDGKQYMLEGDGVTLRDPSTGLLAPPTVTAGKQVNMQCPGQRFDDPFVTYTLGNQNAGQPADQFRCYDGFHVWNQAQSAPYDGRYQFPSAQYIAAHKSELPTCATTVTIGGKSYPNPNVCQTLVSLPPADYVVEAVTPDGYEIVKEEDKNIFTGDQFNGPAAQQFAGLGNVFILPDQATLNNANAYNLRNADGKAINATSNLGNTTTAGYTVAMPECVGDLHRVPDFLSVFPQAQLVAPFSGMDRPLCDRKLVKLKDQTQANANFFMFTPVPLAANGAGIILDDASSEFNAASPDFGEKAAVPFVPVSVKDFSGTELVRTYADQWGAYNLMYPSSWTVNPPTPSGYLPNMLVNCMNDPGPIAERNAAGLLTGRLITDPQFNPAYSNFCYTLPFMPGQTTYLDTPVLPVAAFAQGNNPADCEYPDAMPAIRRVNSSAGFGPYLTKAGGTLTIDALGDRTVPNPAYAGPFAVAGPASQRTLTRHYGFGATKGVVTIGGVEYSGSALKWSDQQIVVTLPRDAAGGQLVVKTFDGQSSVDGVTVTVENKVPTRVDANGSGLTSIQAAIDAATPGDLILVNEGTYNELVVMWKPVRLQGTGGASVYINATKYPTTKLATWRPVINAAFGVDIHTGNNTVPAQVDALPTQEITGGIVLLEPSVLGSEEGPGIAVLAKGINDFTTNASGGPLGTTNAECGRNNSGGYDSVTVSFNMDNGALTTAKPGLSNFACAASRIDGLGITGGDSGGGIYVNGWAHNLVIANNRVFGNAGAYNGGIRIGVPYLELETLPQVNAAGDTAVQPGFGYDKNISIHHNFVSKNGTVEAPVGAGGAGGGVSICTGTDGYSIDHNWICGNYSSSDGGGIGHIGYSQGGRIAFNQIYFNEATQQTNAVSGGGIAVVAEPILAGNLALGTGNISIDANVIRGNLASGGKGGGIFLSSINGQEVANNPGNRSVWFTASITNNIIDNNVAGWAGGGVSMFDTVLATVANNTISSNDSVGVAGVVLADGVGRPEPAGLVSQQNSAALATALEAATNNNRLDPTQRAISNPNLINNILWQNRSFYYGGNNNLCAGNDPSALATCTELTEQATTGQCSANAKYWDLGLLDDKGIAPNPLARLNPKFSVLTSMGGAAGQGYDVTVSAKPAVAIRSATHAGNLVTVSTGNNSPHGFLTGDRIAISGVTPEAYNGTFTVNVTSATAFTYTDPAVSNAVNISSITHVGNLVTVTTAAAHGYTTGAMVTIAGVNPAAYNGVFPVTVTSPTTYTYSGYFTANISSISRNGGQTVDITVGTGVNVIADSSVTISGVTPAAFNGQCTSATRVIGTPATSFRCRIQVPNNTPAGSNGTVSLNAGNGAGGSSASINVAAATGFGTATGFTTVAVTNFITSPNLADPYCNGSRATPEFPAVIVPPTRKRIQVAATSDEGNNYVSVKYGPLTLVKPTSSAGTAYTGFGDYHLNASSTTANSSALDAGTVGAVTHDVDNQGRPVGRWDIGADELVVAAPLAPVVVTPAASLDFGNIARGNNSATVLVATINNPAGNGTINLGLTTTGDTGYWTSPTGNGNDCGTTLAQGTTCNVRYRLTPPSIRQGGVIGAKTLTVTVTTSTPGITFTPTPPSFTLTGTVN